MTKAELEERLKKGIPLMYVLPLCTFNTNCQPIYFADTKDFKPGQIVYIAISNIREYKGTPLVNYWSNLGSPHRHDEIYNILNHCRTYEYYMDECNGDEIKAKYLWLSSTSVWPQRKEIDEKIKNGRDPLLYIKKMEARGNRFKREQRDWNFSCENRKEIVFK